MVFFLQAAVSSGSGSGSERRRTGALVAAWRRIGFTSACIFFGASATELTLLSAMEDLEIIPAATRDI
jgi:hypothetical protein